MKPTVSSAWVLWALHIGGWELFFGYYRCLWVSWASCFYVRGVLGLYCFSLSMLGTLATLSPSQGAHLAPVLLFLGS